MKKGLIFVTDGSNEWSRTHAQVPKPLFIDDTLRIYYGTRDLQNRTYTSYIEVNPERPQEIFYIHDRPVMSLGNKEDFDEKGIMPACFIRKENEIIMYYTGWSENKEFPYAVSIGAALSNDGGITFERISQNPIISQQEEKISCSQPFVLFEDDRWKMWYSSFTKWEEIDGKKEAFYNIKYAESADGINWNINNDVILDYDVNCDAMVNPFVWQEKGVWKMLYSFRKAIGFRSKRENSYRIGYAESEDGINWLKLDAKAGIDISESGWDSEMIAYSAVYFYNNKRYLLYNGNGFGKTGFGYAVSGN